MLGKASRDWARLEDTLDGKSAIFGRLNGLDILFLEPSQPSNLFCIELCVLVGWNVETVDELGFAHWLEHTAIGLPSRVFPDYKANIREMALHSIRTEASTTSTQTCVRLCGIRFPPNAPDQDRASQYLEKLWYWFHQPVMHAAQLNTERHAVIQELKTRSWNEWMPVEVAMERMCAPGSRAALDPRMEIQNIQTAPIESVVQFRRKYYEPANAVLCVCVSHVDTLLEFFANAFGTGHHQIDFFILPNWVSWLGIKTKRPGQRTLLFEMPKTIGEHQKLVVQKLPMAQDQPLAKVLLRKRVNSTSFADSAPSLSALAFVLGNQDSSSRLLRRLRLQLKLVYWATASSLLHPWDSRLSYFEIRTECTPHKVKQVIRECVKMLEELSGTQPPTHEEMTQYLLHKAGDGEEEGCDAIPNRYVHGYTPPLMILQHICTPSSRLKKCLLLTSADLRNAARHFLSPSTAGPWFVVFQEAPSISATSTTS